MAEGLLEWQGWVGKLCKIWTVIMPPDAEAKRKIQKIDIEGSNPSNWF